jgi:mannan endo-1,4-beta-mannosidase
MGLEGGSDYPYTTTEGTDFALNLAIPDIDFGTLHLYTTDCTFIQSALGIFFLY